MENSTGWTASFLRFVRVWILSGWSKIPSRDAAFHFFLSGMPGAQSSRGHLAYLNILSFLSFLYLAGKREKNCGEPLVSGLLKVENDTSD